MENIILTLVVSLFSTALHAAPALKKDWGVFGVWRSAEITGHAFSGKNACMAYTQTSDAASTLEVYAEEFGNPADGYTEPTVQIIPGGRIEKPFFRAIATADKRLGEFQLTIQSTQANPPAIALLARVDQRKQFVEVLKKAGTLTVKLVGENNRTVKTLTFKLRGSSKSIDAIIAGCNLTLE